MSKILNLSGLIFDLVGFVLLFYPDWRGKKSEELYERIPNSPIIEAINAADEGRPKKISDEERAYESYVARNSARASMKFTKLAGFLIILGFLLQVLSVLL